jgi:cysteine dioxygenase
MTTPARRQPPCCCTRDSVPKLAQLISYLDSVKGRADLKKLTELLKGIKVSRADVAPACNFGEAGYRRNRIAGSEHYELLALCWRSGDRTPIHDHQGVSCAFKVVEGTGTEIRFAPTGSGLICPVATIPMEPGYVCCADDADIHEVANFQARGNDLITLHIYSPPIRKMNTYEFNAPVTAGTAAQYAGLPPRKSSGAVTKRTRTPATKRSKKAVKSARRPARTR